MKSITVTTHAAGGAEIQDPFPAEGRLVVDIAAATTKTFLATTAQYNRLREQLDAFLVSGILTSVLVNETEAERSDELLELKKRVAVVTTLAVTGGAVPNLLTLGVRPGDMFHKYVAATLTTTSYEVAAVHAANIFEATAIVAAFDLLAAGDKFYFTRNGVLISGTDRTVAGGITHVIATVTQTPYKRTGFGRFFVKTSDGKPYFLKDDGSELSLGMTGSDPLIFKGTIAVPGDFPTVAAVQSGWLYRVTAEVTDSDVTKTHTLQHFIAGSEIAWNGTNWSELGTQTDAQYVDATPATLGAGDLLVEVDTVTIGGPSVINLPAASASSVGKRLSIFDVSGGAGVDRISVVPNLTNTINGVNAPWNISTAYSGYTFICVQTGAATYGWITGEITSGRQQYDSRQGAAATETIRTIRPLRPGRIIAVAAEDGTVAAAAESMTLDVEIAGVSCLTAPITLDNAVPIDTPVTGVLAPAAAAFAAGDLVTVVRTYVPGGAPTPMANTVCDVMVQYDAP